MSDAGTSEDEDIVLLQRRGALRLIVLNRPEKRNTASVALQRRLLDCLREVDADPAARAIVLHGAGRAFSAGGDRELAAAAGRGDMPDAEELLALQAETNRTFLSLNVPVVAAVRGAAIGWGAGLAAMCDVVIMTDDAFLSDPHVSYGIPASPPTLAIWPLLSPMGFAREALLSGRRIGAEEAMAKGLASRIVAVGEEVEAAIAEASRWTDLPTAGVLATRRALNRNLIDQIGTREGILALTRP